MLSKTDCIKYYIKTDNIRKVLEKRVKSFISSFKVMLPKNCMN